MDGNSPKTVSSLDLLARELGVDRRTLQNWRTDPRYSASTPAPRPDGRYDVEPWRVFVAANGLGGYDTPRKRAGGAVASADDAGESVTTVELLPGTESDWRKLVLKEKVEAEKINNDIRRGTLLVAAELEGPLGAMLVAIQNTMTQFPDRVGDSLVGIRDTQDMIAALRAEIEADQLQLNTADYLETTRKMLASLEDDPEAQRLLELCDFGGQSQKHLRALIEHCVMVVLRQIGRRAIGMALEPDKPAEDAVEIEYDEEAGE